MTTQNFTSFVLPVDLHSLCSVVVVAFILVIVSCHSVVCATSQGCQATKQQTKGATKGGICTRKSIQQRRTCRIVLILIERVIVVVIVIDIDCHPHHPPHHHGATRN
jgi:hypothetical protein